MANDEFHGIIISVNGTYRPQVLWVMANYNSVAPPIGMTEVVIPGPSGYDVEVLSETAPTIAALAYGKCASGAQYGGSAASHTRWCRPQHVYYNLYYHDGYFPSDTAKRYIACHELGHTLGLRHTTAASCMKSATITPKYVPTYTTTVQHDRDHLAAGY